MLELREEDGKVEVEEKAAVPLELLERVRKVSSERQGTEVYWQEFDISIGAEIDCLFIYCRTKNDRSSTSVDPVDNSYK